MNVTLPAPLATPSKTDPKSGFGLLEQPFALAAQSPAIDGVSLTARTSPADPPAIQAAFAKATFSYGALLYRIAPLTNAVQIYNGANWVDETAFDPADPSVAPVELAFDPQTNAWKGILVLASIGSALVPPDPVIDTDRVTGRPLYGVLSIFRTPRKPHAAPAPPFDAVARSPRAPAFSVISSAAAANVTAGPVQHLSPVKDIAKADGFAVFVKDASGAPAADLLVSADGSLPSLVALHFYQGGAERASVAISSSGAVTVHSASSVTIDAPLVTVTGELRAQHVSYAPYGGGAVRYL